MSVFEDPDDLFSTGKTVESKPETWVWLYHGPLPYEPIDDLSATVTMDFAANSILPRVHVM